MHGSILLVTNSQATPRISTLLWARGWGIIWSGPVPGVGGWGKWKLSSPWFCKVCVISRMVYTMAADLKTTYFQRKTQKFVREWLEGNKSLYLNVFKFETNVRMMHTWIFGRDGQKYSFSLALNNDKFLHENKYEAFDIERETEIRSSVLMKCSIKEALFKEFLLRFHFHYDIHILL